VESSSDMALLRPACWLRVFMRVHLSSWEGTSIWIRKRATASSQQKPCHSRPDAGTEFAFSILPAHVERGHDDPAGIRSCVQSKHAPAFRRLPQRRFGRNGNASMPVIGWRISPENELARCLEQQK